MKPSSTGANKHKTTGNEARGRLERIALLMSLVWASKDITLLSNSLTEIA